MKAAALALTTALAASLIGCQRDEAPAQNSSAGNEVIVPAEAAAPAAAPAGNDLTESQASGPTPEPPAPAEKAAPPAATAAWSSTGYSLNGTEPFWGGTLVGAKLVYTTPENQAGEPVPVSADIGSGREVYRGRLDGKPLELTLTKAKCSNGMSDQEFGYTAVLKVRGETRQGCADARK